MIVAKKQDTMPWDARASKKTTAVLWIGVLLASRVCIGCNVTVPVPDVKYMLDGSIIHVSWSQESPVNISAHYCIQKPHKNLVTTDQLYLCQKNETMKIEHCSLPANSLQSKYICNFKATQLVNYSVFLKAELQGCNDKSVVKMICPELKDAHPPPVENLRMDARKDGLSLQWDCNLDYLCYNVTCYEMVGGTKRKKVIVPAGKSNKEKQAEIPFYNAGNSFKLYQCCVRSHLCNKIYTVNSEPVCMTGRTPQAEPSRPVQMLCGIHNRCVEVVKNNLRDYELRWKLPEKRFWNGHPKVIKLELHQSDKVIQTIALNGSATKYTLTGLRTNVTYHVTIIWCTFGGCSSTSESVALNAFPKEKGGRVGLISSHMTVIGLCIIAVILVSVVGCFICDSKRNIEGSNNDLPELHEPTERLPDQAWTGDSVATSIIVNAADYDILYASRHGLYCPDTTNQGQRGDDFDTSSVDSYETDAGHPLLGLSSKTPDPVEKRVMVTYLPQTLGTLSSLRPAVSEEENQGFV